LTKSVFFSAPNEGLARFGLYYLSLNGQNLVDGSMSTSIVLCDVNLDDTRPNREGKISRFMERRESKTAVNLDVPGTSASAIAQERKDEERSMIDVTFRMKENEMFADVKVFSFNLILSVDFLMKLSGFLQPPAAAATSEDDDNELEMIQEDFAFEQQSTKGSEARKARSVQRQQSQGQEQEATKKAIFAIHIEEYDIILVEKMDDINCLALILNVSYLSLVCKVT
jgi:vacuolar protein sorting-associated protein 13A/C